MLLHIVCAISAVCCLCRLCFCPAPLPPPPRRPAAAPLRPRCRSFFMLRYTGGIEIGKMRHVTETNLQTHGYSRIPPDNFFTHEIRTEYGEEVAWYFAFNRHFLRGLVFPACFGLLTVVVEQVYRAQCGEACERRCNVCMQFRVFYILIITLFWGPYFIATWMRQEHVLR